MFPTSVGIDTMSGAGYVGGNNTPTIIYGIHHATVGGDDIELLNGNGGDSVINQTYTAGEIVLDFPYGIMFSAGCYISNMGDINPTVYYRKVI